MICKVRRGDPSADVDDNGQAMSQTHQQGVLRPQNARAVDITRSCIAIDAVLEMAVAAGWLAGSSKAGGK